MLLERFFETHYSTAGFNSVPEATASEQPIRLIKSNQNGSTFDPSGFDLIIEVVGTGQYVGVQIVPASRGWDYDFDSLRLVTENGTEIHHTSKAVLDKIRAVVRSSLVPFQPSSTPAPRQG